MDYMETLNARREIVKKRDQAGELILAQHITADLDWTRPDENKAYLGALVRDKLLTKVEANQTIKRGQRDQRIKEALGSVPRTPVDYARQYIRLNSIAISYRGDITMRGRDNFNLLDMTRGARLLADELGLDFAVGAVNDGVEEAFSQIRDAQLGHIRAKIEPRADFDWHRLAECFDATAMPVEFIIAVLKKFVWQTKRKLWDLPVPYHLMAVIRGAQGKGKSHFVKTLCGPLADLLSITDFEQVADSRNIDLWRSFIIFLDEMGKAAKADMDVTKSVITADNLERRPMRTNNTVRIRQNGTFIGTTNMSLAELIKDETGVRRFIELVFAEPPFGFIDTFDFVAAWQSVHHEDADPMADYAQDLARYQSDWRNAGPVETWLRDVADEEWQRYESDDDDRSGMMSTQRLFEAYLEHRATVNGGQEREHRTRNAFAHELGRLTSSGDFAIEKYRTSSANGWRTKDAGLRRNEVQRERAEKLKSFKVVK